MSQQGNEFNDPELKKAVRQAYSGERASESLRLRVVALVDQASASKSRSDRPTSPGLRRRPAWLKYAVAALVLLIVGAGIEYWWLYEPVGMSGSDTFVYTLPLNYQDGMTAAHARAIPSTYADRSVAEATLTKEIGHKAIAPEIAGWTFKSAESVMIANYPAARMVYTRGEETLSVLSMIVSPSYPPPDGTNYDETCSGAAFAGIVKNGMIYCVITSATTPQISDEVRMIRDAFARTL